MNSMYDILNKISLLEGKGAKPDFLDLDKDGNRKEPMKKAAKEVDESVDESIEEGSTGDYSAKKARAGKDIGKPGKNFEKIAKSAAERYGSKERGEKVAGAVLAKLRTKEDVAQEGNRFTGNLMKARAAGLKTADLDGDGDMEQVRESNMVMVGKATKDGRSVSILHDRQYDEYTINLIDGDTQQRVFAEDRDTAQHIARTWLSEGKTTMIWPGTDEYKRRFGTDKEAFRLKYAPSVMSDPEARKELSKLDIAHDRLKKIRRGEVDPDDIDDVPAAGEKRGRGRPKGSKRSIGAKGPGVQSKLLRGKAIAEQGMEEDYDPDEYDQEGEMAKNQLHTVLRNAEELHDLLGDNDNLPEWVQSKLAKIEGMMKDVSEYMQSEREQGHEEEVAEVAPPGAKAERMVKHIKKGYAKDGKLTPKEKGIAYATAWKAHKAGKVEEESTDKEDQKAERAGKQVAKDIEHDEGHKGKDDNKAEKAGKRVTKDIEYDDKKDRKQKKKDEVEENTVAGSVAPAPGGKAPKGSGGMQFGKGVYEAKLAESFDSKLTTVLNEGMSVSMNVDQDGRKNLTVNATDEDADGLADLLKMAGMQQAGGHEEACSACGQAPCGCEGNLEEADLANAPEPEYSDTDTMVNTLSGGLNGRKSTGQTTIPVLNRDPARQGVAAVAEEIREQQESRLWDLYKRY